MSFKRNSTRVSKPRTQISSWFRTQHRGSRTPTDKNQKLRCWVHKQALSQRLPLSSVPASCWAVLWRGSVVTLWLLSRQDWGDTCVISCLGQQQQLSLVSPVSPISRRSLLTPNQGSPKLGPDSNNPATAPRVERKPSGPPA